MYRKRKRLGTVSMDLPRANCALTNSIAFYNEKTGSVGEGKAVDVVYLDFGKAFVMVSHGILIVKLVKYGLDKCTTGWCSRFSVY